MTKLSTMEDEISSTWRDKLKELRQRSSKMTSFSPSSQSQTTNDDITTACDDVRNSRNSANVIACGRLSRMRTTLEIQRSGSPERSRRVFSSTRLASLRESIERRKERNIPECLDTFSDFFNPSLSAEHRFEKYLFEMQRRKTEDKSSNHSGQLDAYHDTRKSRSRQTVKQSKIELNTVELLNSDDASSSSSHSNARVSRLKLPALFVSPRHKVLPRIRTPANDVNAVAKSESELALSLRAINTADLARSGGLTYFKIPYNTPRHTGAEGGGDNYSMDSEY